MSSPSAVVLDVDGVLWTSGGPEPDAPELLVALRRAHVPFCLLTNDCSTSKARRHAALTQTGFSLSKSQLITAGEIAGIWLRNEGVREIIYLGTPDALEDVAAGLLCRDRGPVDAVVVGDMFSHYSRSLLNQAAHAITSGARFVAPQRNPKCWNGTASQIDNGFWVAGLEYVTGVRAVVTGKPSPTAYLSAASRLGIDPSAAGIAFVSDDAEHDLRGAKDVGFATVQYGIATPSEEWVDFAVRDMRALSALLAG